MTSAAQNVSPLLALDPVPTLLSRVRAELAADFRPDRPTRVSRAPGRLDVMGGIADYTGSLVCEATLDRAAAVALQPRDDRELQVFSFNLFDEHRPFTLRVPLEALASHSVDMLRREFAEPGRRWAAYLAGCLYVLHEKACIDLADPRVRGVSLALLSTVPLGAGVSSSAAVEVATMLALLDHLGVPRAEDGPAADRGAVTPMGLAALCQEVENRVVGAPCGIMDQVASGYGRPGSLLRMVCQPHELQPPLALPAGIRVLGIDSNVRHSVSGPQYARTRCAAFMGHKIILDRMRRIGAAAGRALTADPLRGYLANLDPNDYKRIFRPALPEAIKGGEFLLKYGPTIDAATTVEPDVIYPVTHAVDHHVLEARRVVNFAEFIEQAAALTAEGASADSRERGRLLDKAGHLMYASHLSYTNDAMLGAPECDLLVQLVRDRERHGLYGAKITGGGSGGTVAVLADEGDRADAAIADIMAEYARQTGRKPEALTGTSPGAWHVGTRVI